MCHSFNVATSDNEILNTEMTRIKMDQKAHACNTKSNKYKKKRNKFYILLKQFQMASVELDGPILHRHAHSAQLCKVLQDA